MEKQPKSSTADNSLQQRVKKALLKRWLHTGGRKKEETACRQPPER